MEFTRAAQFFRSGCGFQMVHGVWRYVWPWNYRTITEADENQNTKRLTVWLRRFYRCWSSIQVSNRLPLTHNPERMGPFYYKDKVAKKVAKRVIKWKLRNRLLKKRLKPSGGKGSIVIWSAKALNLRLPARALVTTNTIGRVLARKRICGSMTIFGTCPPLLSRKNGPFWNTIAFLPSGKFYSDCRIRMILLSKSVPTGAGALNFFIRL